MALPWEKYQGTAVTDAPPWEKYQNAAATDSPPWEKYTPTEVDLSTLEAPEGSPQRDDINRSVAGNIFAPPGAFAWQPTLSELINASMPRGVQESQRDEGRIPLAPPLPEQGAFEQGGVEGAIMPGVEAASSVASNLTPRTDSWAHIATDLGSFATPAVGSVQELIDAPENARKDYANARAQMNGSRLSELPFPERLDPVTQAQLMPEGPEKQQALLNAGANVVAQMLMAKGIAHGIAQPEPSHIRTEPLLQEPPPTESLGPGTTAADVSRALERRFALQDTPPEAPPDLAPSPPIEQTLPNIGQPLPFNPELGPQPQPDFQMPLRTETQQFPPPPPGTPLKGTPLVGPNGSTPAADAAAAQPQVAPQVPQGTGMVRLYHGGAGEQAGSDFTPDLRYAQGYADKTPGGRVWQVDVPSGLLKTHDEYGQPVTRVVAPDHIANQAQLRGDERYAGVTPTEGAQLPSAQLPEPGFSTERAQAIYGKDAVLITKGKSAKAWKAIGQADTRNPYDVLEQARARGIATPEDAANLRAEHQKLLDRARQAYGTPEYTDLAQNAVDFLNASKEVVHGPASDVMRGLQEADEPTYMSPADYDNILRERQMQATPDESATFEKVANEVRTKDTEARTAAANGQEAIRKYRPNEVVPFDEAADYVKKQIKDLTEPCEL